MIDFKDKRKGIESFPVTLAEAIALRGMGFPTFPTKGRLNNRKYMVKVPATPKNRVQIREAIRGLKAKLLTIIYDDIIQSIEAELLEPCGDETEESLFFNGAEVAILLNCDPTIPFERNEKTFYLDIPEFAFEEMEKKVGTYSRLFSNLHSKIKLSMTGGDEEI